MTLERLGRDPAAIAAYEPHLTGLPFLETAQQGAFTPPALKCLGALYERQGDTLNAARTYARFAELWKDADADLQSRVRHARERAAALMEARR